MTDELDPKRRYSGADVEIIGASRKLMTKTTAGQLIGRLEQHAEELMRDPDPTAA